MASPPSGSSGRARADGESLGSHPFPSPPLPPMCCLPLSLSSESLHLCISSIALQLRATAKGRTGPMGVARVLISKVFAMPSCFASNTQPRNKKNREKEREISVIKNQMIFPLHYPIPPSGNPFPASGGGPQRRQKISSLILVSLLLQLQGKGAGDEGQGSGWFIHN